MGLVITSRKFFYENKNNSDFATDTGDFTNFLRPLAGEFCKAEIEFTLTNFIGVNPTAANSFVITNISGSDYTIEILDGGSWTTFKEGFVFDVFDNVGAALVVTTGTVDNVIGNTLFFNSATVTTGTYIDADAKTKHEWTDFNFFYRHFGNDYNSPIDGSPQQYHADLGSPQSVSLVTGNALGSGAWQNGSFKTKFVSTPDAGYTQLFTFEHIFEILPYFESGQIADITNVNTVAPYIDGVIKYDYKLEAYNIANVTSIFVNEETQLGQVTWFNSAKSNLPTSYSLTSITYTDTVTSKTLTKLTTENKVHVVVVIADDGAAPFVTLAPFTVKHSLLLEDYTANTTQLYDEIWLNENKRNTLDAVANSGTIITDLTGVRDSAIQITVEFDIELTAPQKLQVQNGFNYLLSIQLENSTKTNLDTNSTPLILDVNNYTVNTDVDGIISETSSLNYKHTNSIGVGGTTDYDGTIEDGVVSVIDFTIAPSVKQVTLNNLAFLVLAYDTVNNVWFEVQRNDIGIAQNTFITDLGTGKKLQQIELDTTRGFALKAGNQFNFKKIITGLFINPSQSYTLTFGFKINWEAFEALLGASTDFYDVTKENNGLNLNTSNYSGAFNRQIRFAREYIYTVGGIKTTKTIMSPDSDINDYDESDTNWTVVLNTENDVAFDLEEKFENLKDTTIVATFSDTTVQTDVDEFEAVIIAKEKNSSDFFEISTQRDVLPGGILKPITGTTASKSIVGDDFVVKCKMDFTKIANPNYSISARLIGVIFDFNQNSVFFDGVNEFILCGNDSSLDFDFNDAFTISAWIKPVTLSGNRDIVSRISSSGAIGYALQTAGAVPRIVLTNNGSNQIVTVSLVSVGTIWAHLVWTNSGNGLGSGQRIYVDGSNQTGLSSPDNLAGNTTSTTEQLSIGARQNGANRSNANIDEVSVWNKALSAAEVTEIYNSACPDNLAVHSAAANLVSWWRMGEGATFPTIPDLGASNDGTMTNQEIEDITTDTIC